MAVATCGSVEQAAVQLGSKTTTVSNQLKQLETQLGIVLVERSTRPLRPTKRGEQFLRQVGHVRAQYLSALSDLSPQQTPRVETLSLGLIDDFNATLSPFLAQRIRSQSPHTQVQVLCGRSDTMIRLMESGKTDAVVTGQFPENPGCFHTKGLLREKLVLVHARYSPLSELSGDALAQGLMAHPYIAYEPESPLGRLILQHLLRLRLAPKADYTFDNNRSIIELVHAQGGWAITTPLNVLEAVPDTELFMVRELPFTDIYRTLWLVTSTELASLTLGDRGASVADFLTQTISSYVTRQLPTLVQRSLPGLSNQAIEPI